MNRISLINVEWNCYNGFLLQFIHLELFKPIDTDSSLFGVNVSKDFLYIDIFWKTIKIFDKNEVQNDN